jgi:hypothetical protein
MKFLKHPFLNHENYGNSQSHQINLSRKREDYLGEKSENAADWCIVPLSIQELLPVTSLYVRITHRC